MSLTIFVPDADNYAAVVILRTDGISTSDNRDKIKL